MKLLNVLFAVSLLSSLNVFAEGQDEKNIHAFLSEERVQFSYSSPRNAYHCDFVRAETSAILRKLGARDIKVSCTGGVPYNRVNYIDARFISVRQTTSEKSTRLAMLMPISLKFSESCDLHETVMRELVVGFDTFDYVESGHCSFSRGQLEYEMKTLF